MGSDGSHNLCVLLIRINQIRTGRGFVDKNGWTNKHETVPRSWLFSLCNQKEKEKLVNITGLKQANKQKIVLWKAYFKKQIKENGFF